jgi:hypothetical protein
VQLRRKVLTSNIRVIQSDVDLLSRLSALETELAELRCAVRDLSQRTTTCAPNTAPSDRSETVPARNRAQSAHEGSRSPIAATSMDSPIAPVGVIRKMYTWITGELDSPQDCVELPESIRAQLASNGLGKRLIET